MEMGKEKDSSGALGCEVREYLNKAQPWGRKQSTGGL